MNRFVKLLSIDELVGATIEAYSWEIYSHELYLKTDKGHFILTMDENNFFTDVKELDLFNVRAYSLATEYGIVSEEALGVIMDCKDTQLLRNRIAELKIEKADLEYTIKCYEEQLE